MSALSEAGEGTQWTHIGIGLSSYDKNTNESDIVVVAMLFSLKASVSLTLKNADGSL